MRQQRPTAQSYSHTEGTRIGATQQDDGGSSTLSSAAEPRAAGHPEGSSARSNSHALRQECPLTACRRAAWQPVKPRPARGCAMLGTHCGSAPAASLPGSRPESPLRSRPIASAAHPLPLLPAHADT
eukprot:scaffold3951_cov121-Isochrysis_galbana.AAC.9